MGFPVNRTGGIFIVFDIIWVPRQESQLQSQGMFRYFSGQYIIIGMMHERECTELSTSTVMVHMAKGERGLQALARPSLTPPSAVSDSPFILHDWPCIWFWSYFQWSCCEHVTGPTFAAVTFKFCLLCCWYYHHSSCHLYHCYHPSFHR